MRLIRFYDTCALQGCLRLRYIKRHRIRLILSCQHSFVSHQSRSWTRIGFVHVLDWIGSDNRYLF